MKTKIHLILMLCVSTLFVGCNTLDTPYGRGKAATYTAVLGLESDDLSNEDLQEIKADIEGFLSSGQSITILIINQYADKIAEVINRDPRRVRIVLNLLSDELGQENGPSKAKEFIEGVRDTLTQLGY